MDFYFNCIVVTEHVVRGQPFEFYCILLCVPPSAPNASLASLQVWTVQVSVMDLGTYMQTLGPLCLAPPSFPSQWGSPSTLWLPSASRPSPQPTRQSPFPESEPFQALLLLTSTHVQGLQLLGLEVFCPALMHTHAQGSPPGAPSHSVSPH